MLIIFSHVTLGVVVNIVLHKFTVDVPVATMHIHSVTKQNILLVKLMQRMYIIYAVIFILKCYLELSCIVDVFAFEKPVLLTATISPCSKPCDVCSNT